MRTSMRVRPEHFCEALRRNCVTYSHKPEPAGAFTVMLRGEGS